MVTTGTLSPMSSSVPAILPLSLPKTQKIVFSTTVPTTQSSSLPTPLSKT